MPRIRLESPADSRLPDYRGLTDTQLRRRTEPAEGLYIAEGSKVMRRAVAAGHTPRSFLLAEKRLPELEDVLQQFPDVPVFIGDAAVLEGVTGFQLHRGALAAMNRPAPARLDTVLGKARRVAVLENIGDHTNLGAVFRSAAALGIDAVLLSPGCADPLYRRAIRVSMGGVFQVPWARLPDGPLDLGLLQDLGFVIGALALTPDSVGIEDFAAERQERLALLLGTEGHGLSDAALAAADTAVRIPMYGGVDSLNVAAAAAVAFWECRDRHPARRA